MDTPARLRLAAAALVASAAINAVAIVALAGMFAGFALGARSTALVLGRTNDILSIPGVLLLAPAVVELHLLTGPGRPRLRLVITIIGLGAIAAIAWLQWLLVTERLTFEQEAGPVMLGFLAIATWFVVSGRLASDVGVMPRGARLGLLAALYVGQPWWALRWSKVLRGIAAAVSGGRPGTPETATLDRYPAAAGEGSGR